MSELTACNYCNLKRIRKQAKAEHQRVVLRSSNFMGGTCVYVIPKGVVMPKAIKEPSDKLPSGDEFHEKYSVSWLMEIPQFCCCQ